jgi:DNA-binding LacI/PurR family transcriptional regulator
MSKSVKMSDIAAKVGVSTVTVSKAISGQKGVSEGMRARIMKLADDMGYVPPASRHTPESGKSRNIGVLIAEMFLDKYNSFYWQMYQEITTRASAKGCFVMLEVVSSDEISTGTMPKLISERKIDGLVIIGKMVHSYLEAIRSNGIPAVYLDFYDDTACDSVISNGFYGTYKLTEYLHSLGHHDIAYVGTVEATESIADRYWGYRKSMLNNGIEFRDEWLIPDRNPDTGDLNRTEVWNLPAKMPTAFVCNCDLTASYLIKNLEMRGYKVPEDISVVGFDNYLYPGLSEIGITTYEVDMKEMARRTIKRLLQRIEIPEETLPIMIVVEGHLIVKESTAAVK